MMKFVLMIMNFLDERSVLKDEFANMLISWDIDEANAEKAYDFITEHGKKRMDCTLRTNIK